MNVLMETLFPRSLPQMQTQVLVVATLPPTSESKEEKSNLHKASPPPLLQLNLGNANRISCNKKWEEDPLPGHWGFLN